MAPQTGVLLKLLQDKQGGNIFLQGQQASATPLLFASVAEKTVQTFLFVLQDADEAGYFYHDLTQVMGTENVLFFPSSYKRSVKYGQRDSANEILRTEVLAKVSARDVKAHEALFIVSYPEALAELVISKKHLDERRLSLKTGQQQIDITDVAHTLRDYGFQEVDYVYEPGQFAVRGSILDVYSFSCEYPYRIDFFGREIDTIRTFEVQDQLSKDKQSDIEIVPELATSATEKISFLKFLPSDTVLVAKDFAYIHDVIEHVYAEGFSRQAVTERLEGATEMEQKQIMSELNKEKSLITPYQFTEDAATFRRIEFGMNAGKTGVIATQKAKKYDVLKFKITPQPLFHKNFNLLVDTFEDYILKGYKLYILADSDKQTQRLKDIFADMDSQKARSIAFEPVNRTLHEGFTDDALKLCFFTDHQIFDRYHKYNLKSDGARAGKMALTMKELQEMEPGDFIVHVDFGIGKFGGLVRVPAGNSYQEMIRIIYQHNDKVDVSIHSLYKISKYRRADTGEPPRLSTLGTGAWDRLKEKTKKRIKDIARDLIKLYAQRRHEKGYAFSGDSYLQHELEASFLYEDTPDQSKATQDVKADMESQRPMDRLVCGDVGFGKTEVAVRAAFKAACDSKQVAVLVPTTVLAYQHYQTFKNRLKGMPVRVDYLSRARSAKQTKQVLTDLEDGKIDILIGTHKLLGKSVKWHDLGLLIIDEEQKFGVSTKEKLRKMKTNVDTLTMSATPIPRTLQFSLMGARDMSIIRTPPPNRYPIHTELATFSHEVIADAINFEMSRNGQVYFVHDRINGLQEIANLIHKYVPDCRVAIGHGQMPPDKLEKVLMGFMNYDYDVLLSTTIVENGIDISNANTMIINDAHRFGLSDLHQMRGRVGRSNRKAFCYLLAPPKTSLTPEARRRLEALENFSELGSGFDLAMQDLDIRGAGNLLGAEQSGFMEDLGYETYQKILSQAVTELKNDEFHELYAEQIAQGKDISGDEFVEDCAIESDLEMYFPDNYVPGSSERMLLYRELDNINNDNDLETYRQRLVDRFGEVPHEALELMQVVPLRRLGKRLGCEKIMLRQGKMNMQFVANPDSAYYQSKTFSAVINYVGNHPRQCDFKQVGTRRLLTVSQIPTVEAAVNVLRAMLDGLSAC
ncbi:transcription-repair coupling factor [Segatella oris]|uniref:Transcription-repair-coupling factor n=1 Tax=Segatella oris C735 TaxID=563008 RepID=D7NC27_9BACT|nr:transcription-repair coupling factor [Segatella oris]EFI48715.1 transcription-repair coupling factor [Segatella oris C735]